MIDGHARLLLIPPYRFNPTSSSDDFREKEKGKRKNEETLRRSTEEASLSQE